MINQEKQLHLDEIVSQSQTQRNRIMKLFYLNLFYFLSTFITLGQTSFMGHSGVYFLGTADVPVSAANYSNPDISGVVVRFKWNEIEASPGTFDWSFVDNEIAKAVTYGKKVSLQPLGEPDWMAGLGVEQYYYIDNNTYHSTYGQVVSNSIVWDPIYVARYQNFIHAMAVKYAGNPTVSYVNTVGGYFSRGFPTTVVTDTTTLATAPFYIAFPYNADTLAILIEAQIDYYMSLFPNTPLWCSVDYVPFELQASGHTINYLATLYTNYGMANYPDRFGLWREDISGCYPQIPTNTGSHWHIMEQNPCRTGAQMLWSVQDGPTRMNPCGLTPNTEEIVLDAAIQKGISLGMRYLEIYGNDIQDSTLSTVISQANASLIAQGNSCGQLGTQNNTVETSAKIYPNPAYQSFRVELDDSDGESEIEIYNTLGLCVFSDTFSNHTDINVSSFANGIYFIKIKCGQKAITEKIVKK